MDRGELRPVYFPRMDVNHPLTLADYTCEQAMLSLAEVLDDRGTCQVQMNGELVRVELLRDIEVTELVGKDEYLALLVGEAVEKRILREIGLEPAADYVALGVLFFSFLSTHSINVEYTSTRSSIRSSLA